MITLQNHFTGTYAKNLLADWKIIANLMLQKSTWVKDTTQAQLEKETLKPLTLTDLQMSDAFNGPFQHFFKIHLRAYAKISTIETALTISKDDLFKESEMPTNTIFNIPEKLLSSIESSALKELRAKLDSSTKEHYALWESAIQNWIDTFIQTLKNNDITLSDIELNDLATNQPISELHDLFINLKIALPKLSKSAFDFQQYFTLKIILTVQSALGRAQQPHGEKEIEAMLKTLQPIFKVINKTEKELLATQEKSVNELVAGINWPAEKK
ncbi:MAG: hypothetical protein NTZ67_01775 [Gammaproteobacteria bacterium]|nr:hypothetical protein [Gammaproteobacteria bacterium]